MINFNKKFVSNDLSKSTVSKLLQSQPNPSVKKIPNNSI